jgi:hypothetical protein
MRGDVSLYLLLRNYLDIWFQLFFLILLRNLSVLLFVNFEFDVVLILKQIAIDIDVQVVEFDEFLLLDGYIVQIPYNSFLDL